MIDREPQTVAERVYEIRRLLGPNHKTPLQGGEFAKRANAVAARFGQQFRYDHSVISKIENGGRRVSIEEIPIFAALDPKKRGESWLAWGVEFPGKPLLDLNPHRDHRLTAEEAARAAQVADAEDRATRPAPTRAVGARKRRKP